jgi:hypothetical protein
MLDKEFKYYKDHQDELVEQYNGKFIAIVETTIKGPFDTELEAYLVMKKDYPVGTFLVQHCLPGTMSYTQTFHSRVVF